MNLQNKHHKLKLVPIYDLYMGDDKELVKIDKGNFETIRQCFRDSESDVVGDKNEHVDLIKLNGKYYVAYSEK